MTNVSVEHYMEDVITEAVVQRCSVKKMFLEVSLLLLDIKKQNEQKTEKKTIFERLYGAVFQFFMQKNYTRQNNTFWCGISTKNHDAGGLRWTKY